MIRLSARAFIAETSTRPPPVTGEKASSQQYAAVYVVTKVPVSNGVVLSGVVTVSV